MYKRSRKEVKVIEPSFIHPSAEVSDSVIGPYASIGANCKIRAAVISDSVVEEGTQIIRTSVKHSLIGRNCYVEGMTNNKEASVLNLGDNSSVINP
jgi:glucose-1-phosphate thymidylyltransferase